MIGHKKIIENLKKLVDAGDLSHGYIFFGPAMVGKQVAAIELALYLEDGSRTSRLRGNDRREGETKEVGGAHGALSDMLLVQPSEKGSIGIDESREVKNFLWQKPNVSARRTVIINEAELLTTEAQNALLKITEEPPASSLIILVTSDTASILPTITSRLPGIHFGTVPEKEIVAFLMEAKMTKAKAGELAKRSFGKPGLAMRLLNDEPFKENIGLAEKFLKSPKATRRDLIKKIIEPDEFDLRKFLDAVIIVLAWQDQKKNAELWHRTLALYGRQTDFGLNPRLQLEALMG